jgi:hypothetical protein
MPKHVIHGAVLKCTMSATPATLSVLPINRELLHNVYAANILDHVPIVNIGSFGMCMSPSNPAVASATAAAMGVLTPMPCVPVTPTPWTPGAPTVQLGFQPALDDISVCQCTMGGTISITYAGQPTTSIP